MPEHFHHKAPRSKNRAPVPEMSAVGSDPDVPVSELLFELPIQEMLYELVESPAPDCPRTRAAHVRAAPGASLELLKRLRDYLRLPRAFWAPPGSPKGMGTKPENPDNPDNTPLPPESPKAALVFLQPSS